MHLVIGISIQSVSAESGEDFGRLFSRQSERKNLDILRQNQKLRVNTPQEKIQAEEPMVAEPAELPAPVTLQGFVKRSDGASTLWVNNKAVQEGVRIDDVQIGQLNKRDGSPQAGAESLNIRIPANGKHVRLKPGQLYDPESNQIKELQVVEKARRLNLEETGVAGQDEKH